LLPRTGDVISSSSSSNQLTAQLLSDFLILFPKDFQNLVTLSKFRSLFSLLVTTARGSFFLRLLPACLLVAVFARSVAQMEEEEWKQTA
jgi:hypothetical protein